MAQLKYDIGVQSDRQKLISSSLKSRIFVSILLLNLFQNWYTDLNNLVRTSVTLNRQQAMKSLEQQVQLLLHSFRFELTDFLQGVTSLMENRLSPLIISLESLNSAFGMLTSNARKHNLVPLGEDPGTLFQVPVSTLCDNVANLYAVIHLPLYQGSTLQLYIHAPAPFFLEDTSIIMDINSLADFLALDTHDMMGQQMNASEFQLSKRFSTVYHCPYMKLLS